MEYITLRLDSTNEVEQWYVRHSYFIVLYVRTLRPQGIVQVPNTTEDHHKVALHRSINRSQRHKYGLLDFTFLDQHKSLMFLCILPLLK